MAKDPWLYNGSMFIPRGFAAELDGSVISLIGDVAALANNIGPDAPDDEVHFPNSALLPPSGTAATLVLTFPPTPVPPSPSLNPR